MNRRSLLRGVLAGVMLAVAPLVGAPKAPSLGEEPAAVWFEAWARSRHRMGLAVVRIQDRSGHMCEKAVALSVASSRYVQENPEVLFGPARGYVVPGMLTPSQTLSPPL